MSGNINPVFYPAPYKVSPEALLRSLQPPALVPSRVKDLNGPQTVADSTLLLARQRENQISMNNSHVLMFIAQPVCMRAGNRRASGWLLFVYLFISSCLAKC